jgi:two-component system, NarL family, sensor histidine kinase DevS
MQTRARNVGGDLEITTEPGEGTTIMAWMPYSQDTELQASE